VIPAPIPPIPPVPPVAPPLNPPPDPGPQPTAPTEPTVPRQGEPGPQPPPGATMAKKQEWQAKNAAYLQWTQYDRDLAQNQTDSQQYQQAQQALQQYQAQVAAYNASIAIYNAQLANYQTQLAAYQIQVAAYIAQSAGFQSGKWGGFYAGSGQYSNVSMNLTMQGGVISGSGSDQVGFFTVQGTYNSNDLSCSWNKSYAGSTVIYTGTLSGQTITGTWYFPGNASGNFQLTHTN